MASASLRSCAACCAGASVDRLLSLNFALPSRSAGRAKSRLKLRILGGDSGAARSVARSSRVPCMFLQLGDLSARARLGLTSAAQEGETRDALAARVDREVERFRARRRGMAKGLERIRVAMDDALRTDGMEHVDDPSFPEEEKVRIVRRLHDLNVRMLAYPRFLHAILPLVGREGGRSHSRVLELASGSGELAFALEKQANARALALEITGSDYQPAYVRMANEESARRESRVRFEEINAYDMARVPTGAYDVVLVAQSLHHFSPGALAKMIVESRRVARRAFVGIDVRRSLSVFPFGIGVAALMGGRAFVHDSVLTMRKVYSEAELAFVAELAAPQSRIRVRPLHPGYSMLTVHFS